MEGDFRVGDWLVQPKTCLLSNGDRSLRVRPKVMDLLVYLAGRAGEVISKDELLDAVWGTEAITESALTRTVTELRHALGDDAGSPRVLETIPKRGYRLIAPVLAPGAGSVPDRRHSFAHRWVFAAGVATLLLSAVALVLRFGTRGGSPPGAPTVARVTFESGLQTDPSFSPDGRYLAYAANVAGNFDIWVRPVAGGDAIQVTRGPEEDSQPDWSPDGSTILFRSEREGGGIFSTPAFGGREERLTTFGYRPRWSPDGTRFLFTSALLSGATPGRVYVGTLDGAPPREVEPPSTQPPPGQLVSALGPSVAWHPDGRRVSYLTCRCQSSDLELVTLDLTRGSKGGALRSSIPPGVMKEIRRFNLQPDETEPIAWGPGGDALYFVGFSNTVDVWKLDIEPRTLSVVGGPHRLTSGGGPERGIALSRDGRKVAYVQGQESPRLWLYELDPSGTRITVAPRPITPPQIVPWMPDLTRDGRSLLFNASFAGRDGTELRELSLADGRDRVLGAARGASRFTPRWSRDGQRIAYRYSSSGEPMRRSIRVLDVNPERDWQLTSPIDGVSDNAWDWSLDGKSVITSGGRYVSGRNAIAFVPIAGAPNAERQARVVTSDTSRALWQAMLSPNGRWLVFQAIQVRDSSVSTLYLMSADGGPWFPLTDGTVFDDKPRWSDDGRTLYYLSTRSGMANVWAMPIDPQNGRPAGAPLQLTHFDGRSSVPLSPLPSTELALGGRHLVLQIADPSLSIWVLEIPEH